MRVAANGNKGDKEAKVLVLMLVRRGIELKKA